MNKKNTAYLFNMYPELFKHRDNVRVSLMRFGFECGDGWFDLINNLCMKIEQWFNNNETNDYDENRNVIGKSTGVPGHFYVAQVKEKFGSLRFYVGAAPQAVHDMIHEAENKSYYICEHCGMFAGFPGEPGYKSFYRDGLSWVLTLCDDCLKKHLDRKGLPFDDYVSDWQKEHNAPFVTNMGDKK